MNILFLGGSTTDCGHCFTPDNLGTGYVKKLSLLPGVTATNGGTDGFTFPDVLRKWRLMYAQSTYDCVVVTCGINDVGVIADLEEAGRPEVASVFLEDSMTALRMLLDELADGILPQPFSSDAYDQADVLPPFEKLSHASGILLLEPFLFPIPQSRKLWFPILQEVRRRVQDAILAFNQNAFTGSSQNITADSIKNAVTDSARNSVTSPVKNSTVQSNEISSDKLFTKEERHSVSAAGRARYVPTQAALDELASRLGYAAVTTDGIHLTDAGHECLANLVARELGFPGLFF